MSEKYSIISSKKRQYHPRECCGDIEIFNHNTLMVYKDDNLFYLINNFKGFWPWAIYEGTYRGDIGENILVKLKVDEYIIIEGGGPHVSSFKTDEEINFAFYVVCSGGDLGTIFALSKNWIYSLSDGYPGIFKIKRCNNFEIINNTRCPDSIVNLYLSLNNTATRGLGYETINVLNPIDIIKEEIVINSVLYDISNSTKNNLDEDIKNIFNNIYNKN